MPPTVYDPRNPQAVRADAANLSTGGTPEPSDSNKQNAVPHIFNFTKGLAHGLNGLLVDTDDFDAFVAGTRSHDPTVFDAVPPFLEEFFTDDANALEDGKQYREWESPSAGHAYVLEGPDPQAIPMAPAPKAGSSEFAAEMAEVYQMALSRDWGVAGFMDDTLIGALTLADGTALSEAQDDRVKEIKADVDAAAQRLSEMRWFKGRKLTSDTGDVLQQARRRFGEAQTANTLFRGHEKDAHPTPFLSQFMVMGSGGMDRTFEGRCSGQIAFGAQRVDQEVNVAIPGKDYMTQWLDYVDVQNRANIRSKNSPDEIIPGKRRPISTLRDLATYVHDDALYQAYLNAALILLDEGFDADPGIPFHNASANGLSKNNQEPFALFGGPHLLTLVTEVSSRALKAVRYQKFTVHQRLRPEAAGALFHTILSGFEPHRDLKADPELGAMVHTYASGDGSDEARARRQLGGTLAPYVDGPGSSTNGAEPALEDILTEVRQHNAQNNGEDPADLNIAKWLLPMAFREGSPMHPAYGAGHATVAGACVTILKAFFAMTKTEMNGSTSPIYLVDRGDFALVPGAPQALDGTSAGMMRVQVPEGLSLESELNKLIWNVSNARNMAGVHYYTDYVESALLGEAIAIGILREQMLCYHPNERVTMTVPLLVRRTLPEALLSGQSVLTSGTEVSQVVIQSDGSLRPG